MPKKQFSGGAVMLKKYLNEHGLVVTRTPKPVRHSAIAPGSRVSSRRRVIDSDDEDSEAPSPKRRAASRRFSPAPAKSRASKRIAVPSTATRTTATSPTKTGSVKIISFFKAPDNSHMCVVSENGQLNMKSVAEVRRTHPKMAIEKSLFAKL